MPTDDFKTVLKSAPIVVFALFGCPYCKAVIDLLQTHKYNHFVVYMNMVKKEFITPFKADILKHTNRSALPAVFIHGKYIGGCNDAGFGGVDGILPLHSAGRLRKIVQEKEFKPEKKQPNLY